MSKIGRKEVLQNSFWRFAERILAQLVTLTVSILLARILTPDDYGAVAVIMIFINFCNILVSHGFNSSLIQKENADKNDFSTAFFANLVVTVVLFLILFFTAPLIAAYFENPLVSPLLRVMALRIPFTAINSVQSAYVSRNMQFKKYFVATIVGTVISGVVGIAMAYGGCGAWALIGQYLSSTILNTVVLWFTVKWRPTWFFSLKRAKTMFSYSSKILLAALLNELNIELTSFVIGKKYSSSDLAYYNKGKQFPQIINTNVNETITGIMFPVLSREQSDFALMKQHIKKTLKASAFIMFPLLLGMMAVSKEFLIILLTEKWAAAIPYMQIFCISSMFRPINSLNTQAVKATGHSGKYFKSTIITTISSITVTLCLAQIGVIWVALAGIVNSLISTYVQSIPLKKVVGYGFFEEIKDLFPTILLSVSMSLVVLAVELLHLPLVLSFILKLVVGVVFYTLFAKLFKFESFNYLLDTLKKMVKKK